MQFQNWGEENFIDYLTSRFPVNGLLFGIGDDCAVIPGEEGNAWLITTDALVENVHFLKEQIPARDLGYKMVAINVSDIAAMGGLPKHALLSMALPKTTESSWVRQLIEGIKEACARWEIALLGGDTVESKGGVFLNLTLTGSAESAKTTYRHQALTGDVICVSGHVGDSGAGLKALEEKRIPTEDIQHLLRKHFHPEPSPEQGVWLASQNEVHAMIDVSDGLSCDVKRLLKSSQKGAIIETSKIPISDTLARASSENGWGSLELALTGGEDYCLLLTVSANALATIQHSFKKQFGSSLFEIGRITNSPNKLVYHKQGEVIQLNYEDFNHFQ